MIGSSKKLRVFNFEILLKLRKFDACEIYMFYSSLSLINWLDRPAQRPEARRIGSSLAGPHCGWLVALHETQEGLSKVGRLKQGLF